MKAFARATRKFGEAKLTVSEKIGGRESSSQSKQLVKENLNVGYDWGGGE